MPSTRHIGVHIPIKMSMYYNCVHHVIVIENNDRDTQETTGMGANFAVIAAIYYITIDYAIIRH